MNKLISRNKLLFGCLVILVLLPVSNLMAYEWDGIFGGNVDATSYYYYYDDNSELYSLCDFGGYSPLNDEGGYAHQSIWLGIFDPYEEIHAFAEGSVMGFGRNYVWDSEGYDSDACAGYITGEIDGYNPYYLN